MKKFSNTQTKFFLTSVYSTNAKMFLKYILVISVVKDKGGLSNAYRSNSPKIGIYVQKKTNEVT